MKKWLIDGFLPMWAKQTVLEDNRRLSKQICALQRENREMKAYIQGLHKGLRTARQVRMPQGGEKQ